MITNPQKQDIPKLKAMWKEIFDDSKNLIDKFFDMLFEPQNTLVWLEKDAIVSMLYMILFEQGVYLYALGTKYEYRNRGIMSQLINYACDLQKNTGTKGLFLVPSDIYMDKYYERFGFEKIICGELKRNDSGLNAYESRIKEYVKFIELHENDNMKFVPEYFMVKDFGGFNINDICGYIPF